MEGYGLSDFVERKNPSLRAIRRWAAKGGDGNLQFRLGCAYLFGHPLRRSYRKARRWFALAAENGHLRAQANLGQMYFHGDGVLKSGKKALRILMEPAMAGIPEAQFTIGCLYLNGMGVKRSYKDAYEWFDKARLGGFVGVEDLMESVRELIDLEKGSKDSN